MPVKSNKPDRPDKYPGYAFAGAFEMRKPALYQMGDYITRKLGSAATAEARPKKAKEITHSAEMMAAAMNPAAVQAERAAEVASSKRHEAKARAKADRAHEVAEAKQERLVADAARKKVQEIADFQKRTQQSAKPSRSTERRHQRATAKPNPTVEITDALRERARIAMANNRPAATAESGYIPKASTAKAMNWYKAKQAAARAAATVAEAQPVPAMLATALSSDTVLDMSRHRLSVSEQPTSKVVQLVARRPLAAPAASPEAPRSRATIKQMLSSAAARVRQAIPTKPAPVYNTVAAERSANAGRDLSASPFAPQPAAAELATVTSIESRRRRPRVGRVAAMAGALLLSNLPSSQSAATPGVRPVAAGLAAAPADRARSADRADEQRSEAARAQTIFESNAEHAQAIAAAFAPESHPSVVPTVGDRKARADIIDQVTNDPEYHVNLARAKAEARATYVAGLASMQQMATMTLIETNVDRSDPTAPADGAPYVLQHRVLLGDLPAGLDHSPTVVDFDNGGDKSLLEGVMLQVSGTNIPGYDDVDGKKPGKLIVVAGHHLTPNSDPLNTANHDGFRHLDWIQVANADDGVRGNILDLKVAADGSERWYEATSSGSFDSTDPASAQDALGHSSPDTNLKLYNCLPVAGETGHNIQLRQTVGFKEIARLNHGHFSGDNSLHFFQPPVDPIPTIVRGVK